MKKGVTAVACAIISFGERVLVVQRSEHMKLPLKWEFPGGKVEPEESEEECVKREIKEELGIEIQLLCRLTKRQYDYADFSIQLIPFTARYVGGEIQLMEHKQYQILPKEALSDLNWAEADIAILNEYLYL